MTARDREHRMAQARERADVAWLRFGDAFESTTHRLAPDQLKTDARQAVANQITGARHSLKREIRRWPVALGMAGVLGATAAMIFWPPARQAARFASRAAMLAWTYRKLWNGDLTNERP